VTTIPIETIKEIQNMASRSPRREICGLVDSANTIYPITNVAGPNHHFCMEKIGYYKALNTISSLGRTVACCYHSHPYGSADPSDADRRSSFKLGLPYLIVAANSMYWLEK